MSFAIRKEIQEVRWTAYLAAQVTEADNYELEITEHEELQF